MNESCAIIRDLLPLYAENMVSAETRAMVEEHLALCEDCRAKLGEITSSIPLELEKNESGAKPLKKFRLHLLLIILGFPIWFPIVITLASVALVIYICIWVVVICAWTIPLSFAAAALGGLVMLPVCAFYLNLGGALFYLGCILCGAGVAVLTFFPSLGFTKAVCRMTVWMFKKKGGKNRV